MASPAGVEPAAFPLGGGRSILLSYGDTETRLYQRAVGRKTGVTPDLAVFLTLTEKAFNRFTAIFAFEVDFKVE